MAQVDVIRNGIIDRLLAITDKDYLMALLRLVDNSTVENEKIQLTKEQKLMLEMSEADLQYGRTISQKEHRSLAYSTYEKIRCKYWQ